MQLRTRSIRSRVGMMMSIDGMRRRQVEPPVRSSRQRAPASTVAGPPAARQRPLGHPTRVGVDVRSGSNAIGGRAAGKDQIDVVKDGAGLDSVEGKRRVRRPSRRRDRTPRFAQRRDAKERRSTDQVVAEQACAAEPTGNLKSGANRFGPSSSAKTTSSLTVAKLKSARRVVVRSSSVLVTSQRKIQVAWTLRSASLAASMAAAAGQTVRPRRRS